MARKEPTIVRVLRVAPMTLSGLARAAGYSYDALMRWKRGDREPTADSLNALANALTIHARVLDQLAAELRTEAVRREHGA